MKLFKSKEIRLRSRPKGEASKEDFELAETEIPEPKEGEFVVKNLYMSVDPYMRGRMNDRPSYVPPFELGKAMVGGAVGKVVATKNPNFREGDIVYNFFGWREYFLTDGKSIQKVDTKLAPIPSFLGILGMTGHTAWIGINEILQTRPSDVVFISAAAGAVGSIAGQLAKIKGCRVIGSAGSDEKVRILLDEFHFDAAINYRNGNLVEQLRKAAPDGVDAYFDNVGGEHLEAAITLMRNYGRIAACGAISQYNDQAPRPGPSNLAFMIGKRLTMKGFIVADHLNKMPEMTDEMGKYLKEGRIVNKEIIFQGIEEAASAFLSMMKGDNIGKTLVHLGQ